MAEKYLYQGLGRNKDVYDLDKSKVVPQWGKEGIAPAHS
jgi:hypothetical protein